MYTFQDYISMYFLSLYYFLIEIDLFKGTLLLCEFSESANNNQFY